MPRSRKRNGKKTKFNGPERRKPNRSSETIYAGDEFNNTIIDGPQSARFIASGGNDIYQFGGGQDTIDYSSLNTSITLTRGGTVSKEGLGTDSFKDLYSTIIANRKTSNLIDGLSGGGQIASLNIDLSKNYLGLENLPGIGSVDFKVYNFDNISGSDTSDTLKGDRQNNIIDGNGGNDTIVSSGGNDSYTFGEGIDTIDYSGERKSIRLVRGGTVEKGNKGIDTFTDFYETIKASKLDNDWIDGLSGGGQIASLDVDLENNKLKVNGLPGVGNVSFNIFEFENIDGSDTNDILSGDNQNNILKGNGGDDLIIGGLGSDILTGGDGADTFKFSTGDSRLSKFDVITDYQIGSDVLDVTSSDQEISDLGLATKLTRASVGSLLSKTRFQVNQSVIFSVEEARTGIRTFLATNDTQAGFQEELDNIIEITGYRGNLEDLSVI